MTLCRKLLMFLSKFLRKNDKFGYMNPILAKLGARHDLCWWFVGKSILDFLFSLIGLFRYLLRFRRYEAKCALKFYGDMVVPIKHSWDQKTRDGDRIPLRSLVLTQSTCVWRTNGRTDRQTDGRICRSIYTARKAAHCKSITIRATDEFL